MVRGALVVLLAAAAVGCNSYRSRAQGPFADRPKKPASAPAALVPAIGPRSLTPAAPPADPTPPAPPGEATPVPPRPPEPTTAPPVALAPPQPARPPAVPEEPLALRPPPVRPATPPVAAATNPQADALAKLAQTASRRWASIDTLEAKLTRREVVGRNPTKTEEVIFQVRREPYAVFMRNVGEAGRGREVLYNPTKHDDKVHAVVGEGDTPWLKAGTRAPSLTPDAPQVKSKSRRSIREAGPGTAVGEFARLVSANAASLKYAGPARRPEFGDLPLELVEQTVRPGAEPDADRGGVRAWYFDAKPDSPSFGLPVLMVLTEAGSSPARELEYYCYTAVKAPAGLTDADFDVARLGRGRR